MPNRRDFIKSVVGASAGVVFTGCAVCDPMAAGRPAQVGSGVKHNPALPYHRRLMLHAAPDLCRARGGHRITNSATGKHDACGGAHDTLYEIPAVRHSFSFNCCSIHHA